MELSWLSKIRIAVAMAIGIVLVGLVPWHKIEPFANGVFAILGGDISSSDLMICGLLSFAAGFLASLVCMPFGSRIGILAAPAGMAIWSFRSADLSTLFQTSPAIDSRLAVYSALRFEGFIWLILAGLCFIGAMAADKLFRKKSLDLNDIFDGKFKLHPVLIPIVTIIATVIVGNLLLNILASDISYPDAKLGSVCGQPANLQIAFAVTITFMICGFLAKLFLGAGYIWPAIATAPLTLYSISIYAKKPVMDSLAASWPAVFFSNTVISILPVQMVAFGCIGAVWGYWLAVSYRYWREFES